MKKVRLIIISILTILMVGLIIYNITYLFSNLKSDTDTSKLNINGLKSSKDMVDSIEQPNSQRKITLDTLPEVTDTLTEVDFTTFKKLFKTSKKSVLILEKTDCDYCIAYEPIFIEALTELEINAYKINISNLSNKDKVNIYDYLNYSGTPTVYIIENGNVTHTFEGLTDKDTTESFLDVFYLRQE
jgi:thiol-disulfide isomerase/thioredoxin